MDDGKREKVSLPRLPLPIVLRALSFYPSPQPPSDTMRPLLSREELFEKHIQKEFKS